MKRFIQQFGKEISAVLSGWDRMVFRGSLRRISYSVGMTDFLFKNGVLIKNFGSYVSSVSKSLIEGSCRAASDQGRPIEYLGSAKTDKEERARAIAKSDGIKQGLIGVFKSVELCQTYDVKNDYQKGYPILISRIRKCSFLYHYMIHPEFGFCHARIQSWFPFPIQICINGHEWLAKTLDKKGIAYQRYENCFPWIKDFPLAQKLMKQQLKTNWPDKLNAMARIVNPIHPQIFQKYPLEYYWSVRESEWSTDIVFKQPDFLQSIYPRLLVHGIVHSSSPVAMRFLGKRPRLNFKKDVISKYKLGPEGACIKHRVAKNSVKLYGKYRNLLRGETTINNPGEMKSYRPSERNPLGERSWRRLRYGVADLARRAEISQAINDRYLDSFAGLDTSSALGDLLKQITEPTTWKRYRVRGLRPSSQEDLALFRAVMHGEFTINGFRNRDLQGILFKTEAPTEQEKRRRSSKVSRLLRMLRAHHLIRRIPSTYRYMLTEKGTILLKAVLAVQQITLDQLNKLAA